MNEELADLFNLIYTVIANYGDERLASNYVLCAEQMEEAENLPNAGAICS